MRKMLPIQVAFPLLPPPLLARVVRSGLYARDLKLLPKVGLRLSGATLAEEWGEPPSLG
jgi:hypothetical protein